MGRGRRADAAELQEAKGNPGKRMNKAARQIAAAEAMAKMLGTAPGRENDPLAPPVFLDQRFAPALAVWNDYAPRLADRNLLDPLDRHTFALFCVWLGEFVTANEDIARNGYSRLVKTVSGDKMPRENHAVARRDTAMKYVLDLSKRFGLTPLDRYALIRDQAAGRGGGLFGREAPSPDSTAAEDDPIGALDGMDSAPPGQLPN